MSAKRSRQLSSARTAWDNVAARCDRAVLCARLLGSCLSARPPAATCLMAWPPSSALLAQPAPAVLLHTRVCAWRRFTAATQIYVAVCVWWAGGGSIGVEETISKAMKRSFYASGTSRNARREQAWSMM